VVQVLNLAPSSAVEVHLIVDNCEQRLSEQQVGAAAGREVSGNQSIIVS
jgi:hypothetical protein